MILSCASEQCTSLFSSAIAEALNRFLFFGFLGMVANLFVVSCWGVADGASRCPLAVAACGFHDHKTCSVSAGDLSSDALFIRKFSFVGFFYLGWVGYRKWRQRACVALFSHDKANRRADGALP
jgi:threonine/homoserine/homoserine lactone efflux protein